MARGAASRGPAPTRLADVAARAGVSESTVSRVLNGKPGASEANRRAIRAALDELGYERPPGTRPKDAGLVGLVVPELDNPVFPLFAQAVESELAAHGYTPVLCTLGPSGVHEDEYVRMLLARNVAGIVFVSGVHAVQGTDLEPYRALRRRRLPIVLVNGYQHGLDAPFVSVDEAWAVDVAVAHLAGLGHRRIGMAVGPERYVPVRRRVAAFHQAMRAHVPDAPGGTGVDRLIAHSTYSIEGGALAGAELMTRGVTGVVCASDLMALGAVRAVRAHARSVPGDVSVVGSDDVTLAEFVDPPLTTVRPPVREMAQAAARALLDEIAGRPAPRAELVFRPELVVRGSTAPPPSPQAGNSLAQVGTHGDTRP